MHITLGHLNEFRRVLINVIMVNEKTVKTMDTG